MHTFAATDRIRIHHNGGFEDEVIICDTETKAEVRVEFESLLDFVGEYIRDDLIGWLEQADSKPLIGLASHLFNRKTKARKHS
jgi:hypothetical protein